MFRQICAVILILAACSCSQGQTAAPSIGSIESLIRAQEYDQALQLTASALRAAPGDFRLWTLQGIAFSLENNGPDALRAFDKALHLSPDYAPALKGEVQLLYPAKDKRAAPLLERILKANPADETAHEMLAVLKSSEGDCPAAIAQFTLSEEAVATHPESLEAYGGCLAQTGQAERAIPEFEKLSVLLPESTYPKYDLAVLLVETKQHDAAIKVLEPLLAADQTDPDLLSLASEAYEADAKTPEAVALLRRAIVLRPTEASYYNSFAVLCLDHESYQVGIDMINAGLQLLPNESSLYLSRGLLYAQFAQYEKAEADFNTAERLDSSQSLSSYAMDLADLEKNNPDKALLEVRAQLKAHPDSPLHHYLLAKLLDKYGTDNPDESRKEAIASALTAVKLKPDFIEARDLLSNLYLAAGQYPLAIEQCQLALQYSSADQTAMYHLIVALRHSTKSEDREQIPALVKRLSDSQQTSRQQDSDRKRFKLVEPESAPSQ
jgi:predicted Zn-dependent protease